MRSPHRGPTNAELRYMYVHACVMRGVGAVLWICIASIIWMQQASTIFKVMGFLVFILAFIEYNRSKSMYQMWRDVIRTHFPNDPLNRFPLLHVVLCQIRGLDPHTHLTAKKFQKARKNEEKDKD